MNTILMPMGGALDEAKKPEVLMEFLRRAGEGEARILIFPQASERRDTGKEYVELFKSFGAGEAVSLEFRTRAEAGTLEQVDLIRSATGIFFSGGTQMRLSVTLGGSALEPELIAAYRRGCILGGTSAGASILSKTMIAYGKGGPSPRARIVQFSAGLGFTDKFVFDQHFFQRARMGRLLNAIAQPGMPHVGLGVDAYTGIVSDSELLRDVFGLYVVAILDAETYHAADNVKYVTINPNRPPIMSFRNIVYHLLAQGNVTYDLKTRTSSLANPAPTLERSFDSLRIPAGAGPLILSGDLMDNLPNSAVLKEFKAVAGEDIFIVATGYPSGRSAENAIKKYTEALGGKVQSVFVQDQPIQIPEGTSALLVIGKDQSKVKTEALAPLKDFWLAGHPVMADNAAMPVFGAFYAPHEPTPDDSERQELAVQKSFWQGRTKIAEGLGWVDITLEPQIIADKRFGRLTSLAYNHPELLAFGVNKDTALLLDAQGARAIGGNGIFVFDFRKATLELGTNEAFTVANAMLDVFVPGDSIQPEKADVNARFDPVPTPVLPTPAPTAAATLAPTPAQPAAPQPTVTLASTSVPATEAPAAQEASSSQTLLIVGLLAVIVALVFWFARKRSRGTD